MDKIPTREEWQNLPGKTTRKQALIDLRRNFNDKEIREAWGVKPANWYNLVSRYTKAENAPKRGPGRPKLHSIEDEDNKQPAPEDVQDSIPSDRHWPRKNVVEAEYYSIVDDAKNRRMEELKIDPLDDVDLPFPTIKGNPAQLRKQFEAVALFLEGLDGEDARFVIRLSVVNRNGEL